MCIHRQCKIRYFMYLCSYNIVRRRRISEILCKSSSKTVFAGVFFRPKVNSYYREVYKTLKFVSACACRRRRTSPVAGRRQCVLWARSYLTVLIITLIPFGVYRTGIARQKQIIKRILWKMIRRRVGRTSLRYKWYNKFYIILVTNQINWHQRTVAGKLRFILCRGDLILYLFRYSVDTNDRQ